MRITFSPPTLLDPAGLVSHIVCIPSSTRVCVTIAAEFTSRWEHSNCVTKHCETERVAPNKRLVTCTTNIERRIFYDEHCMTNIVRRTLYDKRCTTNIVRRVTNRMNWISLRNVLVRQNFVRQASVRHTGVQRNLLRPTVVQHNSVRQASVRHTVVQKNFVQ
jgi:hypothetical protein